jgi:hypothetical protein
MDNSLWKRLRTCRKTDYRMNEWTNVSDGLRVYIYIYIYIYVCVCVCVCVCVFLHGEGPRSRCYGRTKALRLFVQPYDENEQFFYQVLQLMEHQCNEIDRGKPTTRRITCPSATLSTTNPTWTDPGSNPGHRSERPATNLLSHGTAAHAYMDQNQIVLSVSAWFNSVYLHKHQIRSFESQDCISCNIWGFRCGNYGFLGCDRFWWNVVWMIYT